jgi:hypothetical protein
MAQPYSRHERGCLHGQESCPAGPTDCPIAVHTQSLRPPALARDQRCNLFPAVLLSWGTPKPFADLIPRPDALGRPGLLLLGCFLLWGECGAVGNRIGRGEARTRLRTFLTGTVNLTCWRPPEQTCNVASLGAPPLEDKKQIFSKKTPSFLRLALGIVKKYS